MQREIEIVRVHFQRAIELLALLPVTPKRLEEAVLAIGAGERRLMRIADSENTAGNLDEVHELRQRANDLLKQAGASTPA
jgi:hypothetical protein